MDHSPTPSGMDAALASVTEAVTEPVYVVDEDWRLILFNRAAEGYFRQSRQDVLGRSLWELFPQGRGTEFERLCREAMERGESGRFETASALREGRVVEVRIGPLHPKGVVVTLNDVTDRSVREQRFLQLTNLLPAFLWFARPDGELYYFNDRWYEYTGLTPAQSLPNGWAELLHPDDAERTAKAWAAARASVSSYEIEVRYRRRDGAYRWYVARAEPRLDEAGNVVEWAGTSTDIHDLRSAQRALTESESRFRHLADNAPVMVWVTEPDGRCSFLSRSWYEFTGQTPETALGFGWLDATHPDDRPRAEAMFVEANATRTAFRLEYRLLRADGVYRWAIDAAAPRFDEAGEFLGYVGSVLEIHERREMEEALRESQQRLDLAVDAHGIGIFDWEVQTGRAVWNIEAEEIFGLPPGGFEGHISAWSRRVLPEDLAVLQPRVDAAMDARAEHLDFDYRIQREDGEVRHVEGSARFLYAEDGTPVRMVGTNMDVTERKRAEDHQRLLINELNHRVKNTLAVVQGIAQQSFRGVGVPTPAREGFEARIQALSAAHNILTQRNWESASIREIIEQAIAPHRPAGDRVKLSGPALKLNPKTAVALALAAHELATNAVKYGALSEESGRLDVCWRTDEGRFRLEWRERDGPPVKPPEHRGFGARMLERGLARELGGAVRLDFRPEGLAAEIDAPLAGAVDA